MVILARWGAAMLALLLAGCLAPTPFGPAETRVTHYAYGASGWQLADAESAANAHYRDPFTQPVGEDRAVAARAVACVELRTS